jgi:excisionase family DNA binding protein
MATRETTPRIPPRLVGAKPGSAEYGIKYTTLRDVVHRGEIPVIRIGRAWYLDRRDIEQWIETRKERVG